MLEILVEYGPRLLDGLLRTVGMALASFVLAFAVGLVVAACRVSPVPPLRRAATVYTEAFRNVPLAVLMILSLFVLPDLGYLISAFWTAVLALTLYTGAYMAESIRAGINAVDKGEVEAARAVGMTFGQVLALIVLPQALRTVVAPIASLFIAHTKNTSVAALVAGLELTDVARRVGSATASFFDVFLIAAIAYVALLIPAGLLFGVLERKVAIRR